MKVHTTVLRPEVADFLPLACGIYPTKVGMEIFGAAAATFTGGLGAVALMRERFDALYLIATIALPIGIWALVRAISNVGNSLVITTDGIALRARDGSHKWIVQTDAIERIDIDFARKALLVRSGRAVFSSRQTELQALFERVSSRDGTGGP